MRDDRWSSGTRIFSKAGKVHLEERYASPFNYSVGFMRSRLCMYDENSLDVVYLKPRSAFHLLYKASRGVFEL